VGQATGVVGRTEMMINDREWFPAPVGRKICGWLYHSLRSADVACPMGRSPEA
jgi:Transcriptional repressor